MGRSRRIGRGETPAPWLAALAMLALVVQLLMPAAAMAQDRQAMVICTGQGAVTITSGAGGQPAKGFAGLACENCVVASIAALPAPAPIAIPIRYAAQAPQTAETTFTDQPRARAPPRPPSQAPPIQVHA